MDAGTEKYDFESSWRKQMLPAGIAVVFGLVATAAGPVNGDGLDWRFLLVSGFFAVVATVLARRLVRRAVLDGRRLTATTLIGEHVIDVDDITDASVSWSDRLSGAYAILRYRGGQLYIPFGPDNEGLLRRLEGAPHRS